MGDIRRLHQLMPFGLNVLTAAAVEAMEAAEAPEAPPVRKIHPVDSPWIPLFAFVLSAALTAFVLSSDWRFAAFASDDLWRPVHFAECVYVRQPNCVIDGMTFRARGEMVRIADVETPEVFGFACPAERQLGQRATRKLATLLSAGPFELVPLDPDEDEGGRKRRIVLRGGQSLGMMLVADGLARPADGSQYSWC